MRMTTRDAYIAKMRVQLDELNANIDKLEARAKKARKDARDGHRAERDKLHEQSKLAVAKLDQLRTAGEESWETMVAEMEKVRDAFIHSFSYFKSQL
jgi:hypothetical protein